MKLTLALVAALMPALAHSQARPGGVAGRVIDASGRPLVAVVVTVERPDMTPVARTSSGADGEWQIRDLEPARYRITATRPGYRTSSQPVQIEPGGIERLTFVLEAAVYTLDSLIVSAPALSISTTDAELGTRLTVAEISLLPTTLDARRLIALTPGARPDQIWGGASDQANSYSLDGTTINHPGLGGAFFLPSPTWIETLEVRGLGAGAEVGGAQGGLVDVVTHSGGNQLAGSFRMSFESRRLNGSNLIRGEIGRELSNRRELDGQVRGPVMHDRLHFALFGHVIQQDEQIPSQLPSAQSPQPPSLEDRRWLAKLSWTPHGRDVVEGSLIGRHQDGDRVGQTGYEAADATNRLRQWSVVGSLAWRRRWILPGVHALTRFDTIVLVVELEVVDDSDAFTPYMSQIVPGCPPWV